jgi:hypothetical protein
MRLPRSSLHSFPPSISSDQVTDAGAAVLCSALSLDRRLILLSLRANVLTAESESEFIALMRDHRALARVDLRQNPDPQMGILKVCVGGEGGWVGGWVREVSEMGEREGVGESVLGVAGLS